MSFSEKVGVSKLFALLLALVLVIVMVSPPEIAFADDYDDDYDDDYGVSTIWGAHYKEINNGDDIEIIIGRDGETETLCRDGHENESIPWDYFSGISEKVKKISFRGKVIGKGDLDFLFSDLSNVTEIDLTNFDTSNATSFYYMFYNCSSLEKLDLSGFDTRNVINMNGMFDGCSSLKSLDLSSFNTKKVESMAEMFKFCENLTKLNISKFNTSRVTDMYRMFDFCSSLKKLDLKNFNTKNVTDMESMFGDCTSLESLNVSKFNTSKVTNMNYMFYNCKKLKNLDLSNFNMKNVKQADGMMLYFSPNTLKTPINLKLDTYLNKAMYNSSGKKYENLPKSKKSIKLTKTKPENNANASKKYTFTYKTVKQLNNIDSEAVSIISNKNYEAKKVGGEWCYIFKKGKKTVLIQLSALKSSQSNENSVKEINKTLSHDVIYSPKDTSDKIKTVFIKTNKTKNSYMSGGKRKKYNSYSWELTSFETFGNISGTEIKLNTKIKNSIKLSYSEVRKTTVGRNAVYKTPKTANDYEKCLQIKKSSKTFSPSFKVTVNTPGTNKVRLERCSYKGKGIIPKKKEIDMLSLIKVGYTTGEIAAKMKVGVLPVSDLASLFDETAPLVFNEEGEYNSEYFLISYGKKKILKSTFSIPLKIKTSGDYFEVHLDLNEKPSIDDKVPTDIAVKFSYGA